MRLGGAITRAIALFRRTDAARVVLVVRHGDGVITIGSTAEPAATRALLTEAAEIAAADAFECVPLRGQS